MRPVLIGDVLAVARVLARAPTARQGWRLCRILREASRADGFHRARGRVHPLWGDGSVMAAALRRERVFVPSPGLDDPAYLDALILVLRGLRDQPLAQDRHNGTAGSKARRAGAISSPQSVQ